MKHYNDIDYDQFLYPDRNPDFQPDLHWNFLPASEIVKQAAANPPQHKILLVPADPQLFAHRRRTLARRPSSRPRLPRPHPEFRDSVVAAVSKVIADHRGWRNPQPYNQRMAKQPQRSHSN